MNKKNIATKINSNMPNHNLMRLSELYESVEDLTVIIPTLNEEEAISSVIEDIQTQGYDKILIIDGNSTDNTIKIAEQYGVKIIYQKGEGKTGAINTAIRHITTPYFVLLDGDCTYAAQDIMNLLPYIHDNPEVIGARSHGRENITLFNRFGNWTINTLFNIIFGTRLTDVCSGMYMLQTRVARQMNLESKGFDVEVEIAAISTRHGGIVETPIGYYERLGTQKLHPIKDGLKIIRRIILMGYKLERARLAYLSTFSLIFPGMILTLLNPRINLLNWNMSTYTIGIILLLLGVQGGTLLVVDNRINKLNPK